MIKMLDDRERAYLSRFFHDIRLLNVFHIGVLRCYFNYMCVQLVLLSKVYATHRNARVTLLSEIFVEMERICG